MKTERRNQRGPNGTYLETTRFIMEEAEQSASYPLIFENDGGELVGTNYFDSLLAKAGVYFLSKHSGVFRLLVPDQELHRLPEMRTAKLCVVTTGVYQGRDSVEVMFDDGSAAPFALYMDLHQCELRGTPVRRRTKLVVWSRQGRLAEWPAHERAGTRLPNLQPWK